MTKQANTLEEFEVLHRSGTVEFIYKGFECLIRLAEWSGHLNGYVKIPKTHPAYFKDYDELDIECHGGLSFSGFLTDRKGERKWYIGFDCAHAGDLTPRISEQFPISNLLFGYEIWRDEEYVTDNLKNIVQQLIGME